MVEASKTKTKTKDKLIIAAIAITIFGALIYHIRSALTPFLFALIISYVLNPLVERFKLKYKLSRTSSVSLVLGLFLMFFIGVSLLIFPIIYSQVVQLIEILPKYLEIFTDDFYPHLAAKLNKIGFKIQTNFSHLIAEQKINPEIANFSSALISNTIESSITLINVLSLIFIVPVLVFYLLRDWDRLVQKIKENLPKSISKPAQEIFSGIDKVLSGYVRGQFNVCLILSCFYAATLSLCGLNFGFLIGIVTGLLSFIPYVGIACGITATVIVMVFQWGFDFGYIAMVSLVFVSGHLIESNFLTPNLIGNRIGLHPVWLIFGLFFFGAILGFTGVLFAVPLTAISGVVIRYFAAGYKNKISS